MSYVFKNSHLPKFDLRNLDGKELRIRVVENAKSIAVIGTDEKNQHYVISEQTK